MKAFGFLFCCFAITVTTKAGDSYRAILLSKIYNPVAYHSIQALQLPQGTDLLILPVNPLSQTSASIPRFERPKGAVFCRMEDMVTKATKVWLKVGVQ